MCWGPFLFWEDWAVAKTHRYTCETVWTGNLGQGTQDYRAYSRDHDVHIAGKKILAGSADPLFRGDAARHNPEDLLLAALSACHMLWFLHLAASHGIVVESYADNAEGEMALEANGAGQFTRVLLRPEVLISAGDADLANELHHKANAMCFIARSMNFLVEHEPLTTLSAPA